MSLFETETMAELCARQGLRAEAIAIYERLLTRAGDESTRARLRGRVQQLRQQARGAPITAAVWVLRDTSPDTSRDRDPVRDRVVIAWQLPDATAGPVLEVLLVRQTAGGITTETRAIDLQEQTGRMTLDCPGLHSAAAALGIRKAGRFVPLARSSAELVGTFGPDSNVSRPNPQRNL